MIAAMMSNMKINNSGGVGGGSGGASGKKVRANSAAPDEDR